MGWWRAGPEFDHVSSDAPFLEIDPHWQAGSFIEPAGFFTHTGRRMFNTHLLWHMLPHGADARCLPDAN
jgi:hypothetical protein